MLTALLLTAAAAIPFTVQAGSWDGGDWPKYKEGRVIEYLIITGNYESPRALAETVQEETGNPILLLPASGMPSEIYLILPDGKVPAKVDQDQLSAYISGINPKRIIIIGDSSIVPPEYRMSIDRKYEIIVFGNQSWNLNAIAASNLFDSDKIRKKFVQKMEAVKKEVQSADAKAEPAPENKSDAKPGPAPENKSDAKPGPAPVSATDDNATTAPSDILDPLPENKNK